MVIPGSFDSAEAWTRVRKVIDRAFVLGHERSANGAEMIGRAPHVAPLAWLHYVYAPLSPVDLASLEQALGRELPAPLRGLYSICNGLNLFSGSINVMGLQPPMTRDPAIQLPFSIVTPNRLERPRAAPPEAVFFG